LVVLDDGEVTNDLIRDMVELLTSLCGRLSGRRSARNRALKAVRCAERDVGPVGVAAAARGDGVGGRVVG
jgi:putative resolvase